MDDRPVSSSVLHLSLSTSASRPATMDPTRSRNSSLEVEREKREAAQVVAELMNSQKVVVGIDQTWVPFHRFFPRRSADDCSCLS